MTGIWVDTDFGFDDLWALLALRHFGCDVAGISLVAGNAPLPQVAANAAGAARAYDLRWPMWQGADRPLTRAPETAQRILGPSGMRTRGAKLPEAKTPPTGAVAALEDWLLTDAPSPRTILAIGPLTNLAHLCQTAPAAAARVDRLVWMGGSTGAGNHTPLAEFNAVADAEALDCVLTTGLPTDIVDLQFCRKVTFCEGDMPATDPLTGDLLGGYLDIAKERGRDRMAIYDPLAALAIARPEAITFSPCSVTVSTDPDETYGATRIGDATPSHVRRATAAQGDLAALCLDALTTEAAHGP